MDVAMRRVHCSSNVHVVVPVGLEHHVQVPGALRCQFKLDQVLTHLVRFQCSTLNWKVVSASCMGVKNSGAKMSL